MDFIIKRKILTFGQDFMLKYMLRSIEKNAVGDYHIYIVQDDSDELPDWFQLNDKISVVLHSDIIPLKNLPTANKNLIDLSVFNITGLSEESVLISDYSFITYKLGEGLEFFKINEPIINYTEINEGELNSGSSSDNQFLYNYEKAYLISDVSFKYPIYRSQNTCLPVKVSDMKHCLDKVCFDKAVKKKVYSYSLYLYTAYANINNRYLPHMEEKVINLNNKKYDYSNIYQDIVDAKGSYLCLSIVPFTVPDEKVFDDVMADIERALIELFPDKSSFEK